MLNESLEVIALRCSLYEHEHRVRSAKRSREFELFTDEAHSVGEHKFGSLKTRQRHPQLSGRCDSCVDIVEGEQRRLTEWLVSNESKTRLGDHS